MVSSSRSEVWWGTIITINCYLLSILLFYNIFIKIRYINIKIFCNFHNCIIVYDNRNNFSLNALLHPYLKKMDYSKIIKIYEINDRNIYRSLNWKCYDFKEICVNSTKNKYFLEEKFGYLIFKNRLSEK